jgi:hypothetical protein
VCEINTASLSSPQRLLFTSIADHARLWGNFKRSLDSATISSATACSVLTNIPEINEVGRVLDSNTRGRLSIAGWNGRITSLGNDPSSIGNGSTTATPLPSCAG